MVDEEFSELDLSENKTVQNESFPTPVEEEPTPESQETVTLSDAPTYLSGAHAQAGHLSTGNVSGVFPVEGLHHKGAVKIFVNGEPVWVKPQD